MSRKFASQKRNLKHGWIRVSLSYYILIMVSHKRLMKRSRRSNSMNWLQKLLSSTPSTKTSNLTTQGNVPQVPAPFVEVKTQVVAEVILDDGRFATVLKPKMGHILNARHSDDTIWMAQLMTHVVGFDGKAVSLEEVLNLTVSDFGKIAAQIGKNLK